MVAHSFEISSDEDQPKSASNCGGVFEHVGKQLAEHLLAYIVDVFVALDDTFCQFRIAIYKSVQTFFQDSLCGGRSNRNIDDRLQFRLMHDFQCSAGYVDAVIPDAFDVADDLHSRRDETKIRRDRLVAGKNLKTDVIDVQFKLIDLIVFVDDVLS